MISRNPIAPLVAIVAIALFALQGCAETVVGGAAVVGVSIAQERSVGAALDDTVTHASISRYMFEKDIELYRKVGIEVVEGRVLLTGSVANPADRDEAVRLTWQAGGVKEVVNEIQVTNQGGVIDYARDTWITTQLKTKLLLDKHIRDINYNVETVNGIVYMIGIAQDQAELERVTNHARTIRYVRKVVSHVRLKDAPAS